MVANVSGGGSRVPTTSTNQTQQTQSPPQTTPASDPPKAKKEDKDAFLGNQPMQTATPRPTGQKVDVKADPAAQQLLKQQLQQAHAQTLARGHENKSETSGGWKVSKFFKESDPADVSWKKEGMGVKGQDANNTGPGTADNAPLIRNGRTYGKSWESSGGGNSTTSTRTQVGGGDSKSTVNRSVTDAHGRTVNSNTTTESVRVGNQRLTESTRNAEARNTQGNHVLTETKSSSTTNADGQTTTQTETTRVNSQGGGSTSTQTSTTNGPSKMDKAKDFLRNNSDVTATLGAVEKKGTVGVWKAEKKLEGTDTGAGGEVHALTVEGHARAAATVDLKTGNVNLGAQAGFQADLVGASGKAQLGNSMSVKGQVYAQGEAHVGARGEVGAGVTFDPRSGTAKVAVGAEGFAGAEVKGSVGYQNKYFGGEVEASGQAGIGGAARAEVGFENGKFKMKADLGACVGLGGRVKVNVNVNVGAIVKDGKEAVVQGYQAGKKAVNSAVNYTAKKVDQAVTTVKAKTAEVKQAVTQKATEVKQAVTQKVDQAKQYVDKKVDQLAQKATQTANAVAAATTQAVDATKNAVASGWKKLTGWF
jgi:hypothetical protein